MKPWALTKEYSEGKFLVIRRDGTVPAWPHFVLGGRDPAVPAALRAYATEAARLGFEAEYVDGVRELADRFSNYATNEGEGDPEAPPHRTDDPAVIAVMRGSDGIISARWSRNHDKPPR